MKNRLKNLLPLLLFEVFPIGIFFVGIWVESIFLIVIGAILFVLLNAILFSMLRDAKKVKQGVDISNGTKEKEYSEPIICAICAKPLGLNRYAIGKTASGKMLWKCPECAKKGGYVRIVGEQAYFCTKDGVIIETEQYVQEPEVESMASNKETRVKCNVCGHIYCYTQADLDKNEQLKKDASRNSFLALSESIAGTIINANLASANAQEKRNLIVDYSKCPKCNSIDIHKFTDEEWEIEKTKQNSSNGASAVSSADELKKYKELLDMGVITQEEFDAKKKQLLCL